MLKLEVDGREPTVEELRDAALDTYGHFTALQVRGGRTRGLALHLERLDAANRELFGAPLDGEHLRDLMRHALQGVGGPSASGADASLRVIVRRGAGAGDAGEAARVFVVLRPPNEMPDTPQQLKSVPYLRTAAHVKRPGDFGQAYHIDRANAAGYDDALLVGQDGAIAEAGIANIAFFDGRGTVWPDAPALAGVTMQLVAPRLEEYGMPSRTARVTVADAVGLSGACVTNSRGIATVSRIDDMPVPASPAFAKAMRDAYAAVPWEEI
jgi:branched-subunit amino acid aminotransferase/4-amino-4-deoxychorismate lyase